MAFKLGFSKEFSDKDVVSDALDHLSCNSGVSVQRDSDIRRIPLDPVDRIEFLYGPENAPLAWTSPLPAYQRDWDIERLAIATNPEYMNRCRESYAFQDLLGREYNGVVFE